MFKKLLLILLFLTPCIYSWDAKEYEKSDAGQFRHGLKEMYKLHLTGNETILDIGCGNGKLSHYIATHYIPNGRFVGIDSDQGMIALAQSRTTQNINFILGDVRDFSSPEQFDAIVSFWTLHWVNEYATAIQNIATLLKPDGKALLCHMVDFDPMDQWAVQLLETAQWHEYKPMYTKILHPPSHQTVFDAIRQSGLTIESIEFKKNGSWLPIETVKGNLLSCGFFPYISQEKRPDFCDQVIQGLISQIPPNEHGEMFHWVPVIVLVLQKNPSIADFWSHIPLEYKEDKIC
jgi:trans-aconitate methyltransferase